MNGLPLCFAGHRQTSAPPCTRHGGSEFGGSAVGALSTGTALPARLDAIARLPPARNLGISGLTSFCGEQPNQRALSVTRALVLAAGHHFRLADPVAGYSRNSCFENMSFLIRILEERTSRVSAIATIPDRAPLQTPRTVLAQPPRPALRESC